MTAAENLYHDFVVERHRIWERRVAGLPGPWTTNPVLRSRKFTNVYRVLDAGTQFLVKELLDGDPEETLMRCWLYRYTNRPEPWIAFKEAFGTYPDYSHLKSGELRLFWLDYQKEIGGIFGPAYQMFVGKENAGSTRLDWVMRLTVDTFCGPSSTRLLNDYLQEHRVVNRVAMLQKLPRCGPFMSMQITTDFGYSSHAQADENEFILAGPGARAGVRLYVGDGYSAEDIIKSVRETIQRAGAVTLEGRPPSLMDVQNTFCEFSKYMRYRGLPARSTSYTGHGDLPDPVLPAHWSA